MRIKSQIIVTILSAAALIALVGGIAVFTQMTLTRSLALTEATSVAYELAETIAFKAPDEPRSLFERPDALRAFVASQHQRSKRDFVVVDHSKIILADIGGEEHNIGTPFDEDPGNEVGKTLQDGTPRSFTEVSADMPEGVDLLAVPIEYPQGTIIGAALLAYEPLLTKAQQRANGVLWLVGLSAAAAMLIAAGFAGLLLRAFNAGLSGLMRGMESLAKGDAGTRIAAIPHNEFGQLAKGFNAMAAELEGSRAQILVQKAYIEDIVQTAAEGIAVVDGDGRITSANPAAAAIMGRRSDKIEGQEWRSVIVMHDRAGHEFAREASPVDLALTTGRRHQSEVRITRPDGSHVPAMASCSPLSRSGAGIVLTLSDISELRRTEGVASERAGELAALNRELQEKSETTTRLVRLGELLQACVTFPEAFSVVGSAMADFLGGLSGTIHLTSASRNLVDEMVHWGPVHSSLAQFVPEDCWALRRGQELALHRRSRQVSLRQEVKIARETLSAPDALPALRPSADIEPSQIIAGLSQQQKETVIRNG